MPLSDRQRLVLDHARGARNCVLQLVGGSTRSGKTYSCLLAFAWYTVVTTVQRAPEVVDFALLGLTADVAWRNTGAPYVALLERLGCDGKREGIAGNRYIRVDTPGRGFGRVWLFGVGRAEKSREEWLRGASFAGFFADECTQMSNEVWAMLNSRLDRKHVRAWCTFNPGHPGHWFKREVLDASENWDAEVLQFDLDDNPTLDEATKERFRKQFKGAFAARMLEGRWAALTGLIWPFWAKPEGELRTAWLERKHPREHGWPAERVGRVWGLDYGLATTMAVVGARPAVAERAPGERYAWRTRWVIDREYYYDARKAGVSRTEAQHLAQLREMIPERSILVIDPSTPAPFRAELRQYWEVRLGFNEDVLEGLVRTSALLANEVLLVDPEQAPFLVEELEGYLWAETEQDDRPQKRDDHACDALRYLACWLERYTTCDPGDLRVVAQRRLPGRTHIRRDYVLPAEPAHG